MKKSILLSAIAFSSLFYHTANAQIRIHFGINFAPRPVYVPARLVVQAPVCEYTEPADYNGDEDYYYLPDVDAYYSVPEQCYYYNDGGRWVTTAYLPGSFHDFDWRYARHYEVRAPRPYMHNDYYRSRFNGVAFNGRWDHFDNHYYHGYANNVNRFNDDRYNRGKQHLDQYRRDDHFDRNQYNRGDQHFDQSRDNSRSYDQNYNGSNHGGRPSVINRDRGDNNNHFTANYGQHFAQNNGNGHRQGRF